METHQKDIEEKDPFGQNRNDDDDDEKSFLKALLAERALKNLDKHFYLLQNQLEQKNNVCTTKVSQLNTKIDELESEVSIGKTLLS